MSTKGRITVVALLLLAVAIVTVAYLAYRSPSFNLLSSISNIIHQKGEPVYPKTAKYNLHPDLKDEYLDNLSKYDVLIIDMEAQHLSADKMEIIREKNPDIKILAFVSMVDIRDDSGTDMGWNHLRHLLFTEINDNNWWLWDSNRQHVSYWPGTWMINPTTGWRDYLAGFVQDEILSTGMWDGIVFDNVWNQVSWVNNGNIDLNNDGIAETSAKLNSSWRTDMAHMLSQMRNRNRNTIVLTNGDGDYRWFENGRNFEDFPNLYEGGYIRMRDKYFRYEETIHRRPKINIVSGSVIFSDAGNQPDFARMRYTLTTAMLSDGFHDYDWGGDSHNEGYRFDEYTIDVGEPVSEATRIQSYFNYYDDFESNTPGNYELVNYPFQKGFMANNWREVCDGSHSVKADIRSFGSGWNDYMISNVDRVRLTPNETYTVGFKYRILLGTKPNKFFYVMARSRSTGEIKGFKSWTLRDGLSGYASTVFQLDEKNDYQIVFGVYGSGAVSIDNVGITTGDSDFFVWRRDFENAMVLTNPTPVTQRVILPEPYKKINGRQDPAVNNGRVVSEVYIPPHDGIILQKLQGLGKLRAYSAQAGHFFTKIFDSLCGLEPYTK